jgi:DNA-binding IclR family transcriptional regulator
MLDTIPEDLGKLLRDGVASLEGLEVLLLLRKERARAWPLDEIAQRLSIPSSSIEPALVDPVHYGLLTHTRAGGLESWQFAPRTPELDALVDRLATLYDDRRLEVMRLLSAHAMERIRNSAARAFADAFVFGRKKDG